ncbi:6180_t:CDS:2, partial [Scutellospora calospora]
KHKGYFARSDNEGHQFKSLMDVIEYVKPTVLIGLSSTGGVFDENVLRRMGELNKNPIIFPLSNPMVNAECSYEDKQEKYGIQDKEIICISCAILARPERITDRQIYASAAALAESLTSSEIEQDFLYPAIQRIRRVSAQVAAAVIVTAVDEGLARSQEINSLVKQDLQELSSRSGTKWDSLVKYVEERMWDPNNEKFFPSETLIKKNLQIVVNKR